MITGETEQLLDHHLQDMNDDFFGSKKKRHARRAKRKAKRLARRIKRQSSPRRIERREKRQQAFRDIGQVYRDIGGATTIGAAIDSITKPKSPSDPNASSLLDESDYSIDIGSSEVSKDEKNDIPTVVYILGGIVVVGIIGLGVMSHQKSKQYQHYS